MEVITAMGIIAIMAAVSFPSIMKTIEKRELENTVREIQAFMQRAKVEAVNSRHNHRVRFENPGDQWRYYIEKETSTGTWTKVSRVDRFIPSGFTVNVNFTGQAVEFSPMGFVDNYAIEAHNIVITNPNISVPGQFDQRVLQIFMGGSIQYTKGTSDGS